jgi:hypothetical protein
MDRVQIIRELIRRTRADFDSYFTGTPLETRAHMITELAILGKAELAKYHQELSEMIPDTESDGSWRCSYALNTGVMIESLLDYQATADNEHYDAAVEVFFDSVDFKVQEDLEKKGIARSTEGQIAAHPLMLAEREWFVKLTGPK